MKSTSSGQVDRNFSLDFLKGIGCFGVVFIHILFPGILGTLIMKVSQFAVPVFLMVSGYYCFNCEDSVLYRRMKRIFSLLVKSLLFYLLFVVAVKYAAGKMESWLQNISVRTVLSFLFIGNYDLVGGGHLYFLFIQILGYAIIWKCQYHKKPSHDNNLDLIVILLLFICRIIVYTYTLSNKMSWHWRSIFLWDSLPWMMLGTYIAKNQLKIKKYISRKHLIITGVLGLVISMVFILHRFKIDMSEIGVIMLSISLFLFAIMYPWIQERNIITSIGYTYSLYIYIFHIAIGAVVTAIINKIGLSENKIVGFSKPIIVLILSFVASYLIVWCKKKNKIICKLFS